MALILEPQGPLLSNSLAFFFLLEGLLGVQDGKTLAPGSLPVLLLPVETAVLLLVLVAELAVEEVLDFHVLAQDLLYFLLLLLLDAAVLQGIDVPQDLSDRAVLQVEQGLVQAFKGAVFLVDLLLYRFGLAGLGLLVGGREPMLQLDGKLRGDADFLSMFLGCVDGLQGLLLDLPLYFLDHLPTS